jgi:very-short-patch-repair endonuclease
MANLRARQLRNNQTAAEQKLWRSLRQLKARSFHFRRQAPIDGIIVDFVCYSGRLVIEVDGGQHNEEKWCTIDGQRDAFLARNNFRVVRFWNNDVLGNLDGVMEKVYALLSVTPTPTPPRKGEGLSSAQVAHRKIGH